MKKLAQSFLDDDPVSIVFDFRRCRHKLLDDAFTEIRRKIGKTLEQFVPTLGVSTDIFEQPSANRLCSPNDDGMGCHFEFVGAEITPARHRAIGGRIVALRIKVEQ